VGALGAWREEDKIPRLEHVLPARMAHRRPALDHKHPLFVGVLVVVRPDRLARRQLVHTRSRLRTGDPREAAIGGLAHSGRVIFAAAAVMVAIFFTFALSGPLPPKEMGVILGIAVLLDAMLIRLVLMPTLLRVFGHRAWALPRWLDRILPNVSFGHG
jgi:uncharacterized membrane protein YdfJ with MMPL/SSD domain